MNLSQFRATQRFNPAFNLDGDEVSPALVYWGNYWIKVTSYEGSVAYWLVLGNQDWLAKTRTVADWDLEFTIEQVPLQD